MADDGEEHTHVQIKYSGATKTTFVVLGKEVNPGDTFTAPDSESPRYTQRNDLQAVSQGHIERLSVSRMLWAQAEALDPGAVHSENEDAAPEGAANEQEV